MSRIIKALGMAAILIGLSCIPLTIPAALIVTAIRRWRARPAQSSTHTHDWHAWKWKRVGPRCQEWTDRCYGCGQTRTNSGAIDA